MRLQLNPCTISLQYLDQFAKPTKRCDLIAVVTRLLLQVTKVNYNESSLSDTVDMDESKLYFDSSDEVLPSNDEVRRAGAKKTMRY